MAGPGSQASSLHQLITACGNRVLQFVWEQQRGYLELCVGGPFVRHIKSLGIGINTLPPNEKHYRLAVSKDKLQSVAYARDYFADICPELVQYLTYNSVGEVHDVADACLLVIMWLEEHFRIPILNSPLRPVPSDCNVSQTLAIMHETADVNGRKGANITRRIEVTARIAASRARFLSSVPQSFAPRRLTRQFLRNLGMPPSEAADLCHFAFWAVNSLQAPFFGVALDVGVALDLKVLNKLSFSIFKVMGNKRSAAAAAAALINSSKSLEAFKSIMVY